MAKPEPLAEPVVPDNGGDAGWRRASLAAALLVTLVVGAVQLYWWHSAGALWRDEINSVNLAGAASIAEMPPNLQFESFPMLYFLVLRGWIHGDAAVSDEWIRLFGLATSLAIVASLWLSARIVGRDVPLVALTLFACHPVVIRYSSSIRGYGLGVALIVITYALIWRAMAKGTAVSWVAAGIAAILSAHTLYQNWFFLFAICVASATASIAARRARAALIAIGIGAVTLVSVLPYGWTLQHANQWNELAKIQAGFVTYAADLVSAIQLGGRGMALAWLAVPVAGIALFLRTRQDRREARDPSLYGLLTFVLASISFLVFLGVLRYQTRPWYFVPWMGIAAVSLEPVIMRATREIRVRSALAIAALGLVAVSAGPIRGSVQTAHTNIDAIAQAIAPRVSGSDLVVVYPWMCGISFERYYRGSAPWATMPPVADHRWHRWDEFARSLESERSLDDFRARIRGVLSRGGRVWLVTMVPFERTMGDSYGYQRAEQAWRVAARAELETGGVHVFGPWEPEAKSAYFEALAVEVWKGR